MKKWLTTLLIPCCMTVSAQSVEEEQIKVHRRLLEIHEQVLVMKESPAVQERLQEAWSIIQQQKRYEGITEEQFYKIMEPYYAKKMLATKTYHHKGTENWERESHKSIEMLASTMTRNVGLTYQKYLNKERKEKRKTTPKLGQRSDDQIKKETAEREEQKYLWTYGLESLDRSDNANNRKALILALGANGIFDQELAFEAFTIYAENGNPAAMNNLGIMYLKGWGTNINPSKALEWFERAGTAGCADGFVNAGLYYKRQNDMNEARHYFNRSTDFYHPTGYYLLGYMDYYGEGCTPDYDKAFKHFKDAASFGDISAVYMLGECYRDGKGVETDEEISKLYFDKAKHYSFKQKKLKK